MVGHETHRIDSLPPDALPNSRRYRCAKCGYLSEEGLDDGRHAYATWRLEPDRWRTHALGSLPEGRIMTLPLAGAAWPIVCATGHRPQHLTHAQREWCRAKLARAAEWLRDEHGTSVGISGMALGVDLWWAAAVLNAGPILGAYVQCPPNPRWSSGDRREYDRLLDLADPEFSRIFSARYTPDVMRERNEAMVHDSDAVVCVWLPGKCTGGTWNAVLSAHARSKPGLHLDPESLTVRRGLPDLRPRVAVGSMS